MNGSVARAESGQNKPVQTPVYNNSAINLSVAKNNTGGALKQTPVTYNNSAINLNVAKNNTGRPLEQTPVTYNNSAMGLNVAKNNTGRAVTQTGKFNNSVGNYNVSKYDMEARSNSTRNNVHIVSGSVKKSEPTESYEPTFYSTDGVPKSNSTVSQVSNNSWTGAFTKDSTASLNSVNTSNGSWTDAFTKGSTAIFSQGTPSNGSWTDAFTMDSTASVKAGAVASQASSTSTVNNSATQAKKVANYGNTGAPASAMGLVEKNNTGGAVTQVGKLNNSVGNYNVSKYDMEARSNSTRNNAKIASGFYGTDGVKNVSGPVKKSEPTEIYEPTFYSTDGIPKSNSSASQVSNNSWTGAFTKDSTAEFNQGTTSTGSWTDAFTKDSTAAFSQGTSSTGSWTDAFTKGSTASVTSGNVSSGAVSGASQGTVSGNGNIASKGNVTQITKTTPSTQIQVKGVTKGKAYSDAVRNQVNVVRSSDKTFSVSSQDYAQVYDSESGVPATVYEEAKKVTNYDGRAKVNYDVEEYSDFEEDEVAVTPPEPSEVYTDFEDDGLRPDLDDVPSYEDDIAYEDEPSMIATPPGYADPTGYDQYGNSIASTPVNSTANYSDGAKTAASSIASTGLSDGQQSFDSYDDGYGVNQGFSASTFQNSFAGFGGTIGSGNLSASIDKVVNTYVPFSGNN